MKKYLFFNTETTGLPLSFKMPGCIINNLPRLIQLS